MDNFNFKEFDFDEEYAKIKARIRKPNILICGATGVGKSSLINYLFGQDVARVGTGYPVTDSIQRYEVAHKDIVLYDTVGYEIGNEKQQYFRDEMIGFIDKCRMEQQDISGHIHLVWYCISAANKRVTEVDVDAIRAIQGKGCNIGIILTQIDSVDEEELAELKQAIYQQIRSPQIFTVSVDPEVPEEYLGWNKLVDWSKEQLDESLQTGFVMSLKRNIKQKKQHVKSVIIPTYAAAAGGVAVTPLPFSDSVALIPIQSAMCIHILHFWGLDEVKGGIKCIIESSIVSQVGKLLASTLTGTLLKFIPGIGSAAGALVNTGIATTFTAALGLAISELSSNYLDLASKGEEVSVENVFTNKAIGELTKSFINK